MEMSDDPSDPRDPLAAALAAARAEGDDRAPLPEALAARMMADAAAAQPRAAPRPGGAWLSRLFGDEGWLGWPAATGLAAAALAGLWIGYAPPPALDGVAAALLGPGMSGPEDAGPADLLAPLVPGALDV
jgi:hypothetical protein